MSELRLQCQLVEEDYISFSFEQEDGLREVVVYNEDNRDYSIIDLSLKQLEELRDWINVELKRAKDTESLDSLNNKIEALIEELEPQMDNSGIKAYEEWRNKLGTHCHYCSYKKPCFCPACAVCGGNRNTCGHWMGHNV